MSLIFDALQRSEAERSGLALSALSGVTEVLQRAELHANSARETAALLQQPVAAKGSQNGASPQSSAIADVTKTEPLPNDAHDAVFDQFERLQPTTPATARLVCYTDAESLAAEKFRFLGVSLQLLRRDRVLKKVLITSTIPQEGKSMASANLACSLARTTRQNSAD